MKIYKYIIWRDYNKLETVYDSKEIEIEYQGAYKFISAKRQRNSLVVYCAIGTDGEKQTDKRIIKVCGTGHLRDDITVWDEGSYLGTVSFEDDNLMFHVFVNIK